MNDKKLKGQDKRFTGDGAADYDTRIKNLVPGYQTLQQIVPALLHDKLAEDAQILIVGAGTGSDLLSLALQHPSWTFLALDPAKPMLDIARRRAKEAGILDRVEFVARDIDQLQSANSYDAAVCLLVAHFIPDDGSKEKFLGQIARRIKQGAPFVCADLCISMEQDRWRAYKSWARGRGRTDDEVSAMFKRIVSDFHPVDETRLFELLDSAGFGAPIPFFQALDYRGYITTRQ